MYTAEVDWFVKGTLPLLPLPTLHSNRSTSGCCASCPAHGWTAWQTSSEHHCRWDLSVTLKCIWSPLFTYESTRSLWQKWRWSPGLQTSLAVLVLGRCSLLSVGLEVFYRRCEDCCFGWWGASQAGRGLGWSQQIVLVVELRLQHNSAASLVFGQGFLV